MFNNGEDPINLPEFEIYYNEYTRLKNPQPAAGQAQDQQAIPVAV